MRHPTRSLAVLVAFVSLAAADIPWPSSGKLPFPGGPALANGAWFASAGSNTQPQFTIISNGHVVSNRVNPDGALRTSVNQLVSYTCLDSNTTMYISQNNYTANGSPLNSTLSCAVSRINATHRVLVNYDEAGGLCPDLVSLAEAETGYEASAATGVTKFQVFTRVDGVLPGEPVLVCKNSTTPLTAPATGPVSGATLGTEAPVNLGIPLNSNTAVGVWNKLGVMNIITPSGFAAGSVGPNGVVGINARYLSHQCNGAGTYVSANEQLVVYSNGTTATGYHCEKGVRDGDTLSLTFSKGPDCTELTSSAAPSDETLALVENIPGFPAECVAVEPESGSSPAVFESGTAAPAAGRAALGGALVVAVVALLM